MTTLRLYDVVKLIPHPDPDYYPSAGALLQRYYACTLGIRYPQGHTQAMTRARFQRIASIIRDAGGCIEGMIPGMAMANVPSSEDLDVVLSKLRQCRGVQAKALHAEAATS
jgi:hypothetical protein